MKLKNIILKLVATTMVISIVFGNISICGIGKAIAENSNTPDINIELQNEKEEKTEISINFKTSMTVDTPIYNKDNIIEFWAIIKNITDTKIENAKVQYLIPECLDYQEGGLGEFGDYATVIKENVMVRNNVFEYNLTELNPGEEKLIIIKCKVKKLEEINQTNLVDNIVKVYIGENVYKDTQTIEISQAAYQISLEANIPENQMLQVGDTVIYTINSTNVGNRFGIVEIQDAIPEQIEVQEIEYGKLDGDTTKLATSSQDVKVSLLINEQETQFIKITGVVKEQEVDKTTVFDLINTAKLVRGEEELLSNEVKLQLKVEVQDDNNNQDNSDSNNDNNDENQQPSNPTDNEQVDPLYTISGIAWIDENKDGKKDENEKLQDSVIVSLINKDIGNFALDTNGNRIKTTTDNSGKYTFNNIPKGNYIVLFEFDTNTYTVSTYKKSNVEENLNSDVILTTVTIDGTKKTAAITDSIELNSNIEDINIGLTENATFDLSLSKQITKITVINSQGTEVTEYDDGDIAKIDLVAKYMNGADVIINYKFTITNEGDITGYVDSLVDDMPSGLEFSTELNKDWYKGGSGKLYTTSLSEKAIKPGESIEIELLLTKKMTEENTGIFPNNANLEKISNLENIEEKNETLDNNQSSATLIISIKTGNAVLYIGLTCLCIAIIGVGAYFIKKNILDKEII